MDKGVVLLLSFGGRYLSRRKLVFLEIVIVFYFCRV